MPAIVTDQFRILNASNFVAGVSSTSNSFYVAVGLPNPAEASLVLVGQIIGTLQHRTLKIVFLR